MFSPILCIHKMGQKHFFMKSLWGGSLWEVEVVRRVSDRLNLFDFSECGGIGGNIPLPNKACSLTIPHSPKCFHRHVHAAPFHTVSNPKQF